MIHDIVDGSFYQNLQKDSGFLGGKENSNVTSLFNTDGISLYSSSHIELWPIFLVINELPPGKRFSRENMLLVGIWQGKGKPPFKQYLEAFSTDMNELYRTGIEISVGKTFTVKLGVIGGTLDLPAKAGALNMTYFNGEQACITCEEPGCVVKQGKGHARSYPYRDPELRSPMRTLDSVRVAMQSATETKRCKGFKGISGLANLECMDMVCGIVPDYMHGLLLGITKNLMYKWFSPTNSGQDYFIGKRLKDISQRLMRIKPTDAIERLPRDIEKHYGDLKATEYQAWLLYYGIPVMLDILPTKYLRHFALFSEATHILLGDSITDEELRRAETLLTIFYKQFANYYGAGSCGLNVHNVSHLVHFVRLMGPIWAWSCFAFEDANSMILHAVHGTGNVMQQILRHKNAVVQLAATGQSSRCKQWRSLKDANGCSIAGAISELKLGQNDQYVRAKIGVGLDVSLQKAHRIVLQGDQLYSKEYGRMQKRVCFIVLTARDQICAIDYFLINEITRDVYAVVKLFEKLLPCPLANFIGGKHLHGVKETQNIDVIPVETILEKLVYIAPQDNIVFVCRSPNKHGHSVFK